MTAVEKHPGRAGRQHIGHGCPNRFTRSQLGRPRAARLILERERHEDRTMVARQRVERGARFPYRALRFNEPEINLWRQTIDQRSKDSRRDFLLKPIRATAFKQGRQGSCDAHLAGCTVGNFTRKAAGTLSQDLRIAMEPLAAEHVRHEAVGIGGDDIRAAIDIGL
ncbi:hypothetical protein [Rhizobium sp. RU36D]|uniref:hypothetical protein n=1 Tax=Rhizobium sp. RU36D TaxID=1907415 RepID=UPI001FCD3D63|nr:hypothetical protein [Rhizobium sp. RU36D]